MNIPGFTARASLDEPRGQQGVSAMCPADYQAPKLSTGRPQPRSVDTPLLNRRARVETTSSIVPTARDERQEAYKECLDECRIEGGTNCVNECLEITASPRGSGPEGTSGLPIYGNYCGPGHGDPAYRTPPVDAVDAVCMDHDRCYDARGYFNCGCDYALITRMPFAVIDTPSMAGKLAGAAAQAWFSGTPCTCWGLPWPVGVGGNGPC